MAAEQRRTDKLTPPHTHKDATMRFKHTHTHTEGERERERERAGDCRDSMWEPQQESQSLSHLVKRPPVSICQSSALPSALSQCLCVHFSVCVLVCCYLYCLHVKVIVLTLIKSIASHAVLHSQCRPACFLPPRANIPCDLNFSLHFICNLCNKYFITHLSN